MGEMQLFIFIIYFIVINLVGFAMMGIDKSKAKRHRRRIPEKTLFLVSVIGGSVGTLAGMYSFRHKTRHLSFVAGIPTILAAQIVIGILLWQYFG